MLARVARRANELELSRDVLENTLNKNPGNVMLLQEQARIELETGDFQRWIQTADEALQHKPDADQAKEVPSLRSQAVEKLRAFVEGQK
jgi:predicted Zn-dependent protease